MNRSGWRHIPPYDFRYRYKVKAGDAGIRLIDFYESRFRYLPRDYWENLIRSGDSFLNDLPSSSNDVLREGDVLHTIRRDVQEPPVNADYEMIYEDQGLFIINKKAPMPVHPSGRYFKNSLTSILEEKFPDKKFHTIHRLDLWTTGVLILATDEKAAKILHRQVEKKLIKKCYAVLAVGEFGQEPFSVTDAIGRVGGAKRGVSGDLTEVRPSETRFVPLVKRKDVTLLAAEPVTGRTNQIRVHVQASGGHILNDPLYGPRPIHESEMEFLGLHCRAMKFILPDGASYVAKADWPETFLNFFSREELDLIDALPL